MAATGRSGSSRRKAEIPGKIRIQLKGKNSKVLNSEDDDEPVADTVNVARVGNDDIDNLPVTFDSGVPDDLPEGTFVVQPEPVEDNQIKKKREAAVRIDTSVLDNVSCTACGRQVNPYKGGALQKHPTLKVVICKRCEKFLSSSEIAKDKDGTDEQCRWCGEGGRLVVCDDCASAFCKACVMRNFNRSEFNNINSQPNWKCYLCNKAPLHNLRENYRKIRDTLKALQEKDKAKAVTQAATPATNTPPSEKPAGSKQMFKTLLPPSPSIKAGSASGVFSAQKNSVSLEGTRSSSLSNHKSSTEMSHKHSSNGNMKGTVFGIEDINVTVDNVFAVVDKLAIATDTFREILHAVQSQSQFSVSTNMNFHALRLHCAKTLNMGIDTYIKSLKTILSGSQHMHDSMAHMMFTPDMFQAIGGMGPASSMSASEAFALSRLPANPFMMPMGSNVSHHSNRNIIDTILAQQGCSPSTSTANYMSEIKQESKDFRKDSILNKQNESLLKEKDSSISNSELSKESYKDHQKDVQPAKDKNRECAADSIETVKTSKDGNSILTEDCKSSPSKKSEQCIKTNNMVGVIKDEEGSDHLENSSPRQKKRNKNTTDKELHTGQDKTIMDVPDVIIKKEAVSSPTNCSGSADDNTDTKFDLIKELADEMLRDGEDKEDRSGDSMETDCIASDLVRSGKSKGKKVDISSDSNAASDKETKRPSLKTSVDSSATLQESNIIKHQDVEASKPVGKLAKHSAGGDNSSSSVMSSDDDDDDDDDVDLATRRKMKKQNEIQKPTEKITKQKQEKKPTEGKTKTNGKQESALENSKVNGNSTKTGAVSADVKTTETSKQLSERKRKASNLDKDAEESEKKIKVGPKIDEKKRSKPGPKSSKKGTDYDHHSSGGNTMEGCDGNDDDIDDEDEPTVTFFLDPVEDQQVVEEDGNIVTENGALDNMEGGDDEEGLSGDKDKHTVKKTKVHKSKKGQKKHIKEDDEKGEDDNKGSRSKRKKVNKVHQASSDSESDADKPRKKVKDDEEDSFKAGDSSSSGIDSDASNSDDADESNDSEAEDDNGQPKPKKKGKRKSRKKKRKSKSQKESDDEDNDNEDQDGDEEKSGKKKMSKGKKKTKKNSSSSSSSGDDAEQENKDDDDDDDDDDDPNSSKSGKRKQIRKVMSNKRLESSTIAAAKAEEKRRRRIAAKQREFNIETITDENNPMNCLITTKLVLEAGKEEGDEPLIQVNKKLVRKLKPHQVEGVQFMWDCMYESVKRAKKEPGAGCILAHCMGLGKTLSVVSFVHTILSHEKVLNHRTCLVVSPLNTVLNWRNEWSMWLDEEDQLEVWELASCKQNAARVEALKEWQENGGVMIMGYEMYRNLTTGSRCKNKRQKKIFQDTLVDPGPDLVICDEGHILKNETSAISKAMNQMKTRRRVVLTGTPLQNNLTEYHCMVSFVKPSLLGTRKEFTNRFINPIQNGQCTDSTLRDVKIMKARAHVLHEMLAGCVQRRDYSALTKFLPPKQEYVISVRLTNIQIELYEKYLEITGQGLDGVFSNKGARLFADYQNLMKIWTHPWVLKLAEIRDELKMKYDDDDSFIEDDSEEEQSFSSSGSSSEDDKGVSDNGKKGANARLNMQRGTKRTRAKARRQAGEDSDPEEVIAEWKSKTRTKFGDDAKMEETDKSVTKEWWAAYVTEDDKLKLELSNKLHLLFEILRMCEEIGDKVLIFSQSILSLNIIESFLEVVDSKYQQERESLTEEEHEKEMFGRSWTKNLDYYRMDGSTSAQNRQLWASNFNDLENYRARLFLISTRAGGLGINLVAANRVIIFDASWNPSHDVQSIFRVYRFGQTKPCYIYRFLAQGTMEEKIYERQVTKLSLSQRVVDEHQIERHFSANDLKELYNFRPDRWDDGTEKPTLALPKDPLLAEVLTNNKHSVFAFHEHDSLLENQVEQTLTEEEKKAAWEEYENEKRGIIIRGPGMERTASWPMMAAAQILSREQITATVQALRQQLPDVSEDLFHLHLQQALRRQVQIKQEEMRRMELLRLQEMNYLNMIKQQAQQSGLTHAQSLQAMQNMAPWMQIQRLRAMQQSMLMGAGHLGMIPSASMSLLGQALNSAPLGNKPDDAIDLEDN